MPHVWLIVCLLFTPALPETDASTQDTALFTALQHELNLQFALENLVRDNDFKRQLDEEEAAERAVEATSDWMECRLGDLRRCPHRKPAHLRVPKCN